MEKQFVIAETIGGWRQVPVFEGTWQECQEMMSDNPAWGYGTSNMGIHPAEEWEVDYL